MAASAPSTPTDLDWLADALWPQATPQIAHGHRSSGLRFVANPHRARPRLLVPADSPRAAAQSVRRYHDGASPAHRLKMGFTEAALRVGGARFLRSRRITIEPGPGPGLVDLLADRLERPIARFAVTLGPPRPNRKPVLQLFDERGSTIGFAKVSVDPFTDELVRRESTWLELAHRHRDPALRVPAVVWSGEIGDQFVSVVAPTWARRRPPSDPSPPPALLSAIHRISTPVSAPALASAPARALLSLSDGRAEEAVGLLSIPDGHRSALGAWHGDLTPWNLLSSTGKALNPDTPWGQTCCIISSQSAWNSAAAHRPTR